MQASAVILAAGRSRRMGEAKLALPFRGDTVLGCVLRALARPGIAERVIVLGHHRERIGPILDAARLSSPPLVEVTNPDPEGDMACSVRIGVGACSAGSDYFLITPGDLPALDARSVDCLLEEAGRTARLKRPPVLVPVCGGHTGHPLAVPERLRADILASQPGWMLRNLVFEGIYPVHEVEVDDEGIFRDFDLPSDRHGLE